MPFEGAGPFWPSSVAGEGANNDQLASGAPAVVTNGNCRWTQGQAAVYILHKPGVANVNTPNQAAQPAAIAAQDFGYNVLKTDMNATANLPAKRRIPSGTWTFKVVLNAVAADVNAVWGFYVNIYTRSSAGTYTHQAGIVSNLAALVAGDNDRTASVTGVPEIILDTDETIHCEFWMRGQGPAAGNTDVNLSIGNPGIGDVTNVALPGVGLRYQYPRSGAAAVSLTAAVSKRFTGATKIAALSLTATATKLIAAARSGPAALSLAAIVVKKVTPNAKVASLSLAATVQKKVTLLAMTAALTLAATVQKLHPRAFTTALALTATSARRVVVARAFTTALTLTAAISKFLTAARSFTTSLTLAATGLVEMAFDVLNRITGSGGGETVVIHDASSTGGSPIGLQFIKPADGEDRKRIPDETLATIVASLLTFKKPRNH